MKLTSLIGHSLCVGLAVAQLEQRASPVELSPPTLVQRDLATVTSAFASVGNGISALDAAVQKFASAADAAGLQTASANVLAAIKAGTTAVKASAELTLQETVQLQSVVTDLQKKGDTLRTDLAAKRPVIQSLGLCKIVLSQVTDIASGSKELSDAVLSKVPEAARQIAASLASGFTNTIAQTQQTFAEGNCTNSGTAPTTPANPTSPANPPGVTPSAKPPAATTTGRTGPITAGSSTLKAAVGWTSALAFALALTML